MSRITVGMFSVLDDGFPVYLDGELIDGVLTASDTTATDSKPTWARFESDVLDAIRSVPMRDFLECFESFSVAFVRDTNQIESWEIRRINVNRIASAFVVRMEIGFDARSWSRPFTVIEFADEFKTLLATRDPDLEYWPRDYQAFTDGFGIEEPCDADKTIGELIEQLYPVLEQLAQAAESDLLAKNGRSVSLLFEFPEPVRPACEQYLLYFSQFLKDLGISAETQMREQASQVLFTVTPTDKNQALDAIREALDTYLQFPGSPNASSEFSRSQEIAIIQLNANVLHLRSQVALAGAVLQAKDATINAQQTEIEMLKGPIDLRGYLPEGEKSKDSEQIIEGILAVKKVEHKGIEVNLPEIVRKLKRLRP